MAKLQCLQHSQQLLKKFLYIHCLLLPLSLPLPLALLLLFLFALLLLSGDVKFLTCPNPIYTLNVLNWQIVKLALDAHGRSLLRAYGYNGYTVSAFKQNLYERLGYLHYLSQSFDAIIIILIGGWNYDQLDRTQHGSMFSTVSIFLLQPKLKI
uniref:Uncharacterized protein n=1 Tax=Glossina pallidipes TaxID=7398 RepID=A0A1A9Z3B0_GLOPL